MQEPAILETQDANQKCSGQGRSDQNTRFDMSNGTYQSPARSFVNYGIAVSCKCDDRKRYLNYVLKLRKNCSDMMLLKVQDVHGR